MLLMLSFASVDDKEKFEYLYDQYKKLLLYKAYSILKDYSLAEDAVSEAYIRIYRNLDKIEDPKSNKAVAFIVTIARNTALTLLEKENKNKADEVDDQIQDSFNLENYILSEAAADDIYTLLDGLNEDLRAVFLFKFAYGLSHKEIGRMLNISENNVTVRYHRARQKLMALLKKEGYANEKKQAHK